MTAMMRVKPFAKTHSTAHIFATLEHITFKFRLLLTFMLGVKTLTESLLFWYIATLPI